MTENEYGDSLKFYGDWSTDAMYRTGLNLQYVVSRTGDLTLHIEAAPIAERGQSPSWENKVTLQLTKAELVSVCATLLGYRRTAKGAFHGTARNKGFQVSSNPSKGALFVLSEQGKTVRHMIDQSGRAEAAAFVVQRLGQAWGMDAMAVISLIERVETLPHIEPA